MLTKTKGNLLFFLSLIVIFGLSFLVFGKLVLSSNSSERRFSSIFRKETLSDNYNNLKLGDTLFTLSDSLITIDRQIISINDILKDVNLVLLASQYNCQACVDRKIDVLNEFSSNDNNINIMVIAIDYKYRDFLIFKNAHPTKFPIYNLNANYNKSLEGNIGPVFFLISKDGEILEIHVADKEHPNETLLFLKHLNE